MFYNGIELDLPQGKVALTHSIILDSIRKESSTRNMDWTDVLGEIPWGSLKDKFLKNYVEAGKLYSLIHMDYQVCNGGIEQYFFNGYHEERSSFTDNDVELYDIDVQKEEFKEIVQFAKDIFPERVDENIALSRACDAFQALIFEADAEVSEMITCDEDEYVMDEETGELVDNPDYFEPYEEFYCEDIIHGDDGFDEIFYDVCDYFEELLEMKAQYACKSFAQDIAAYASEHPDFAADMESILPADITNLLSTKKASLASQIESAESRAGIYRSTSEMER